MHVKFNICSIDVSNTVLHIKITNFIGNSTANFFVKQVLLLSRKVLFPHTKPGPYSALLYCTW